MFAFDHLHHERINEGLSLVAVSLFKFRETKNGHQIGAFKASRIASGITDECLICLSFDGLLNESLF